MYSYCYRGKQHFHFFVGSVTFSWVSTWVKPLYLGEKVSTQLKRVF